MNNLYLGGSSFYIFNDRYENQYGYNRKKNYEALLKLEKKSAEMFRKEKVGYDLFFAYEEY
jgi:hypothetical protein